jgi:aquaporin Z
LEQGVFGLVWKCRFEKLIYHFNPAVTLGFLITKYITRLQLLYYFTAEILGALIGSLFVMTVIGREADLGANSPNYVFPLPTIFGIEVLASALLMAVIVVVVYANGLRGYSGIVIGGIVDLDIFFFAFISGASMNPARSLAPALTLEFEIICVCTGAPHLLERQ